MSKPYCGVETKLPLGHHRGNMVECHDSGQIRYFGINKIDVKLLLKPKKINLSKKRRVLYKKMITLRGRLKYNKEKVKSAKRLKLTQEQLSEYEEIVKNTIIAGNALSKEIEEIEKIIDAAAERRQKEIDHLKKLKKDMKEKEKEKEKAKEKAKVPTIKKDKTTKK